MQQQNTGGRMRLKEWLNENGIKQDWFRKQMKPVPAKSHFSEMINGKRTISLARALEIRDLTKNQVKPEDWVDQSA
jgi:hypothetical protein